METPDFDISVCEKDIMTGKDVVKFVTSFPDNNRVESVIIPMATHDTLCVSSQSGCRFNCLFCTTGKGGFNRSLEAKEIVRQVDIAFGPLNRPVRNVVYMGMGEPFDNLENVLKSIDIISDPKGLNVIKRRISVSTAGHAEGLEKLSYRIEEKPETHYQTLRISVSLNASRDSLRSRLMPINKTFPLSRLKKSILTLPQSRRKDGIYIEYIMMEGINDTAADADGILSFIDGFEAKVNIIPFNPGPETPYRPPSDEVMNKFHRYIIDRGRDCRTRKSKGRNVMAACGQLSKDGQLSKESG